MQAHATRSSSGEATHGEQLFCTLCPMVAYVAGQAYGMEQQMVQQQALRHLSRTAANDARGQRDRREMAACLRQAGLQPALTEQQLQEVCLLLQRVALEWCNAPRQPLFDLARQLAELDPANPAYLLEYARQLADPQQAVPAADVRAALQAALMCATEKKGGRAASDVLPAFEETWRKGLLHTGLLLRMTRPLPAARPCCSPPSDHSCCYGSGRLACDGRGNPSFALRRCTQCRAKAYCSRECQRRAWPQHKRECRALAAAAAAGSSGQG